MSTSKAHLYFVLKRKRLGRHLLKQSSTGWWAGTWLKLYPSSQHKQLPISVPSFLCIIQDHFDWNLFVFWRHWMPSHTTAGVSLSQGNTVLPGILDIPRNQSYSYCSLLTALIISSAINLAWNPILARSLTRHLRQPNTYKNSSHTFCIWASWILVAALYFVVLFFLLES